jgi:hypothetical protein
LVLVTYAAPQGASDAEGDRIPLRCGRGDVGGRDGWGYRHFVRRWVGVAERFHNDIAAALERGRRRRLDRTRVRYELAWSNPHGGVDRAMTVIIGLLPQQPDMAIRGIVTAYWWDHPERPAHLLDAGWGFLHPAGAAPRAYWRRSWHELTTSTGSSATLLVGRSTSTRQF